MSGGRALCIDSYDAATKRQRCGIPESWTGTSESVRLSSTRGPARSDGCMSRFSSGQPQIDFWIIGAQKAGTTSLFEILREHPDICMPETKEIHFFASEEFWSQGPAYLPPHFPDLDCEKLLGGAYVHDIFFEESVQRMHAHNPNMRMIAMLRNPIDRAYSAYWFARRNGWENAATFEEGLEREEARLSGRRQEQSELTYFTHGLYATQLRRFNERFGADRVHCELTEDLKSNPADVLARTLKFLALPSNTVDLPTQKVTNTAGFPRFLTLQKILLGDSAMKRVARRLTTNKLRRRLKRSVIKPVQRMNIRSVQYEPMREETRQMLRERYEAPNAELEAMLGRTLPWH